MATKKTARKTAAKKTGARKTTARKAVADVAIKPARGRPAGKRSTKPATTFGYMTEKQVPGAEGSDETRTEYSAFNGPFVSAKEALEDAAMVAGDDVDVLLFKVVKRGRVQRTTKIV